MMKKKLVVVISILIFFTSVVFLLYSSDEKEKTLNLEFRKEVELTLQKFEENVLKSPNDYEFLKYIKIGEASYAMLLDRNYRIMYHPNTEFVGTSILDLAEGIFDDVLGNLTVQNNKILFEYEFDNIDRMIFFYLATDGKILCIAGATPKNY